jgi:acetyltransferase
MTVRNLEKLLEPRSVAVIGAFGSERAAESLVLRNLQAGGFAGPVWPVAPGKRSIDGHDCFAGVAALPEPPDLAVLAMPAAAVPELVGQLGARGCRIAVVLGPDREFADGVRERMLEAARPYLMRLIGPDTLGVLVPRARLNASLAHRDAAPGKLMLLTQSSSIAATLIDWAAESGIGFSGIVSPGAMADVDMADCLDLAAGDPATRAVLVYLAGVRDARKFLSAARAVARMKPVIVLKPGRSPQAAEASATHTGAMAGSDAVFDAALRRAGVLRVEGLSEMLAAAETVARFRPVDRAQVAVVTNAGGAGVLAVDRLMQGSAGLAVLAPETLEVLDGLLPPGWSGANPVDLLGDADAERYVAALEAVAADLAVDVLMALHCPSAMASPTEIARALARRLDRGTLRRKPVLACWMGGPAAREGAEILREAGIAAYETPASAAAAASHLIGWGRAQAALLHVPDRAVEEALRAAPAGAPQEVRRIFARAAAEGRSRLTEPEAKAAIAAYGIAVPDIRRAAGPPEAAEAAETLLADHARVVVKLVSREILHKSDVGGVVLNIETRRQAEEAARGILERAERGGVAAEIEGFAVEPMVQRPDARELIMGVSLDPVFGPTVLFGAGGLDVEVVSDTAVALPPLDAGLAADLISRTRVSRLLAGHRGRPPADAAALQQALIALSHMAEDFPCLRVVDVNPLLADAAGVVALDAVIEIDPGSVELPGPNPALAILPYPSQWRREVQLGGGNYEIRPIRPADALLYEDFLANMSAEDLRMRFMAARNHFPVEMALRLTQLDYDRDIAFVAVTPEGVLAGVSRMTLEPSRKSAEYALIVRSDMQGRGLGAALMRALIDYARATGVEVLEGIILSENRGMLGLVGRLGFVNRIDPDDGSVTLSRLEL